VLQELEARQEEQDAMQKQLAELEGSMSRLAPSAELARLAASLNDVVKVAVGKLEKGAKKLDKKVCTLYVEKFG
jgi:hypothetical protein